MIRNGAARSLSRCISRPTAFPVRNCFPKPAKITPSHSSARSASFSRRSTLALTSHKPITFSLQRYATTTTGPPFDHIDKKTEEEIAGEELEPRPEEVSTDSSVRHITREEGVEEQERDTDMLAGVKSDLVGCSTFHRKRSKV